MSVILVLAFALLGIIAVTAITASLGRYATHLGALRDALLQPPLTEELRLTLRHHVVTPTRPKRGTTRSKRRTKSVKQRQTNRAAPRNAA